MAVRKSRGRTAKRTATVSKQKTYRERLAELRNRAGYSGAKVAAELGYASPPGYLRYEQKKYQGDKPIPNKIVKRLIPLFRGAGSPPITVEELLDLTDNKEAFSPPVVAAFRASVVTDGDGLLQVRVRIESGVYTQPVRDDTTFGASRVGVSKQYPTESQFVAAVPSGAPRIKPGTQLHCVSPSFREPQPGSAVVVAVPYKGTELVEYAVGVVGPRGGVDDGDGRDVSGSIIGVVIGRYVPE